MAARISIVIPAWNEEEYLSSCLDAVLAQELPFHEVIVVDNNSTDATARIASEYAAKHPQIRVIHEPNPGVIHARNTGFDAATGDIIGRIDADTILEPNWTSVVDQFFADYVSEYVAVTGGFYLSGTMIDQIHRKLVERRRDDESARPKPTFALSGNNMAVAAQAWRDVRAEITTRMDVQDDLDLSAVLMLAEKKLALLMDLRVTISARRYVDPPRKAWAYQQANVRSYTARGIANRRLQYFAALGFARHFVLFAVTAPYDPQTQRFSLRRLLRPTQGRALPVNALPEGREV